MCNVHPPRCILIMIEIPFLYNTIYIPQVFALNRKITDTSVVLTNKSAWNIKGVEKEGRNMRPSASLRADEKEKCAKAEGKRNGRTAFRFLLSIGNQNAFRYVSIFEGVTPSKEEKSKMKKLIAWILCLVMMAAAGACAEVADPFFVQFAGTEWTFSSGVGGWSTEMRILPDGMFSGEYHDSEMGESTDAYPHGTVYGCSFMGKMTVAGKVSDGVWKIRVEELTTDGTVNEEYIDDGIRYVVTAPYGVSAGDEMLLYQPGTPMDALTEDMQFWVRAHDLENTSDTLETWFLSSEKNESGFVAYQMPDETALANPWEEMDAEKLKEVSGISFGVPEGARDIVYRYMKSEGLAEMLFTIDGDEFCARVHPVALANGEIENISGMYFLWENEEAVEIRGCYGTIGQTKTGSEDFVELCLWYDASAE